MSEFSKPRLALLFVAAAVIGSCLAVLGHATNLSDLQLDIVGLVATAVLVAAGLLWASWPAVSRARRQRD